MDPLTISSLLAVAAGALGSEAVKDLYEATKQRTLQRQLEKYDLSQNQKLLEHFTKLEALLSEKGFHPSTVYSGTQSGSGGLAQGPGSATIGKGGVAVGGDNYGPITINPTPADPLRKAKQLYLTRLINEFQILTLAAMGGGDELKGDVTLDQVYIDLDTETPQEDLAGTHKRRAGLRQPDWLPLEEQDVYAVLEIVRQTKKVLLLGGPGSGKSTFARNSVQDTQNLR